MDRNVGTWSETFDPGGGHQIGLGEKEREMQRE